MSDPIITVMAVNCDAPDWVRLFVLSVRKFTQDIEHEILVIDNGSLDVNLQWLRKQPDVRLIEVGHIELYHGGGMNLGTQLSRGRYVCILDSDAHVQRHGWAQDLIALYHANEKTRLIGVIGPPHKPLHPPLFLFERDFIVGNDISWKYRPSADHPEDTDTAQRAYWEILKLGHEVVRLEKGAKLYKNTSWYDQLWLNDKPLCAHFWSGSRFQEACPARTKQILDGVSLADHLARKAAFFSEPEIMAILEEDGGNV